MNIRYIKRIFFSSVSLAVSLLLIFSSSYLGVIEVFNTQVEAAAPFSLLTFPGSLESAGSFERMSFDAGGSLTQTVTDAFTVDELTGVVRLDDGTFVIASNQRLLKADLVNQRLEIIFSSPTLDFSGLGYDPVNDRIFYTTLSNEIGYITQAINDYNDVSFGGVTLQVLTGNATPNTSLVGITYDSDPSLLREHLLVVDNDGDVFFLDLNIATNTYNSYSNFNPFFTFNILPGSPFKQVADIEYNSTTDEFYLLIDPNNGTIPDTVAVFDIDYTDPGIGNGTPNQSQSFAGTSDVKPVVAAAGAVDDPFGFGDASIQSSFSRSVGGSGGRGALAFDTSDDGTFFFSGDLLLNRAYKASSITAGVETEAVRVNTDVLGPQSDLEHGMALVGGTIYYMLNSVLYSYDLVSTEVDFEARVTTFSDTPRDMTENGDDGTNSTVIVCNRNGDIDLLNINTFAVTPIGSSGATDMGACAWDTNSNQLVVVDRSSTSQFAADVVLRKYTVNTVAGTLTLAATQTITEIGGVITSNANRLGRVDMMAVLNDGTPVVFADSGPAAARVAYEISTLTPTTANALALDTVTEDFNRDEGGSTILLDATAPSLTGISIAPNGLINNQQANALTLTATFDEPLGLGSTLTVTLNNTNTTTPANANATVVLNNVSGSTLTGVYNTSVDDAANPLAVTNISAVSVNDVFANNLGSIAIPADYNGAITPSTTLNNTTPPSVVSARYIDRINPGDRLIDTVEIVFNEDISYTPPTNGTSPWEEDPAAQAFFNINLTSGTVINGNTLQLALSSPSGRTGPITALGDSTQPRLRYNPTNGTDAVLSDTDAIPNVVSSTTSFFNLNDEVPPQLTANQNSIHFSNDQANLRNVDKFSLTFTEDISFTFEAGDYSITSNNSPLAFTPADIASTAVNGNIVNFIFNTPFVDTTGGLPQPLPLFGYNSAAGTPDSIQDLSTNTFVFVGSSLINDLASPALIRGELQSSGNDGIIDRVLLEFSEPIRNTQLAADFVLNDITFTDNAPFALSIDSPQAGGLPSSPADNQVLLSVTAANVNETGYNQIVTPTSIVLDDSNGLTFVDRFFNPNAAVLPQSTPLQDAVSPVLVAAEYQDVSGNGNVDRIVATFSEEISLLASLAANWAITNDAASSMLMSFNNAENVVINPTNARQVFIPVTATGTGEPQGVSQPTLAYNDGAGSNQNIRDAQGNFAVSNLGSPVSMTDAALPRGIDPPGFETSDNPNALRIEVTEELNNAVIDVADVQAVLENGNPALVNLQSIEFIASGSTAQGDNSNINENRLLFVFNGPAPAVGAVEVDLLNASEGNANPIADFSGNELLLTDTTAPTIDSIITVSTISNTDGLFDAIDINFIESDLDANPNIAGFSISPQSGEAPYQNLAIAKQDNNTYRITFTSDPSYTSDITPLVSFDDAIGDIQDSSGNFFVGNFNQVAQDRVAPELLSASAIDDVSIQINFSENIVLNGVFGDFSATGITPNAVSALNKIITLGVNPLSNTAFTATDLALNANIVQDSSANQSVSYSNIMITDRQAPIAVSAVTADNNNNGIVDRVILSLSEPVSISTTQGFSLQSATNITAVSVLGQDITLEIDELPANDRAFVDTLDYTTPGTLSDTPASNAAATFSIAVNDGIEPFIQSAQVTGANTIELIASEDLNAGAFSNNTADYTLEDSSNVGVPLNTVSLSLTGAHIIELTSTNPLPKNFTGTITNIAIGALVDTNNVGNTVILSGIAVRDAQAPLATVVEVTAITPNPSVPAPGPFTIDNKATTLLVEATFDEDITQTPILQLNTQPILTVPLSTQVSPTEFTGILDLSTVSSVQTPLNVFLQGSSFIQGTDAASNLALIDGSTLNFDTNGAPEERDIILDIKASGGRRRTSSIGGDLSCSQTTIVGLDNSFSLTLSNSGIDPQVQAQSGVKPLDIFADSNRLLAQFEFDFCNSSTNFSQLEGESNPFTGSSFKMDVSVLGPENTYSLFVPFRNEHRGGDLYLCSSLGESCGSQDDWFAHFELTNDASVLKENKSSDDSISVSLTDGFTQEEDDKYWQISGLTERVRAQAFAPTNFKSSAETPDSGPTPDGSPPPDSSEGPGTINFPDNEPSPEGDPDTSGTLTTPTDDNDTPDPNPTNASFENGDRTSQQEEFVEQLEELLAEESQVPDECLFKDISQLTEQQQESIMYLCALGIMKGHDDGTFKPNDTLSRAALSESLARFIYTKTDFAEVSTILELKLIDLFPDVSQSVWYAPGLALLLGDEKIEGYPNGRFKPEGKVNRAELRKIVVNAVKEVNELVSQRYNDIVKSRQSESLPWFAYYDLLVAEITSELSPAQQRRYDRRGSRGLYLSQTVDRLEVAELIYSILHLGIENKSKEMQSTEATDLVDTLETELKDISADVLKSAAPVETLNQEEFNPSALFLDTESHWARQEIEELYLLGLLPEQGQRFYPDMTLTQEQAYTYLAEVLPVSQQLALELSSDIKLKNIPLDLSPTIRVLVHEEVLSLKNISGDQLSQKLSKAQSLEYLLSTYKALLLRKDNQQELPQCLIEWSEQKVKSKISTFSCADSLGFISENLVQTFSREANETLTKAEFVSLIYQMLIQYLSQ